QGATPGQSVRDGLGIRLVGADPGATFTAQDLLLSRSNYFRGGDQPLQRTDVAQYGSVVEHAAPGVDVAYSGNGKSLQFDLKLAPGTDPSAVELAYAGAQSVGLDAQGRVVLHTPGGDLLQDLPALYQTDATGARQAVSGNYVLKPDGNVGFHLGSYDHSRE